MENRIKAVMIGHAVGDALGVPVEFCSREELMKKPVIDMMGYGTYPVPAGVFSDDTSMALCALDSLANGKVDYYKIMENFVKWYSLGEYTPTGTLFDIGRTCSEAIRTYTEGNCSPIACGLAGEYDNGNGSLMRIHPFSLMAWYKGIEWETMIDDASSLTHASERSKLACRIYTLLLFALLDTPKKTSVREALQKAKERYTDNLEIGHYARLFSESFQQLPNDQIHSSGYVVDTLEAAVWCLLTTDNYKDCVLKAVNLGEDTDTVAAVAGGLAGALYGYEAIPKKWRDILIKREYVEQMCERAQKAWYTED